MKITRESRGKLQYTVVCLSALSKPKEDQCFSRVGSPPSPASGCNWLTRVVNFRNSEFGRNGSSKTLITPFDGGAGMTSDGWLGWMRLRCLFCGTDES